MLIKDKIDLDLFICRNWDRVNAYLDDQAALLPMPVYTSVDIREGKFKYAPVDNNLFPAGFNNICVMDLAECGRHFSKYFDAFSPKVQKIGIFPESHTKNLFYLDHLAVLQRCLRDAGLEVQILSTDPELFAENAQELNLISHSKYDIQILRAKVEHGKFVILKDDFTPEAILLNHDQSSQLPIAWDEIKIPVVPSPYIGWYRRQKTCHFKHYHEVARDFCKHFEIDPELIEAKFKAVEQVDFMSPDGVNELHKMSLELFSELPSESKIFIKASQGTYGMGISVISDAEEVLHMNRKQRNKMDVGKNNLKFTSALLQEGVETVLKYDNMPAEVTIYLINGKSVGGFMRANPLKDANSNLNSKGMVFQKFCISEIKQNNEHKCKEAIYSIVARLSALASARELQKLQN